RCSEPLRDLAGGVSTSRQPLIACLDAQWFLSQRRQTSRGCQSIVAVGGCGPAASGTPHGRLYPAAWQMRLHRPQHVLVHPLLLDDDTIRAEVPPLARREVRRDLRLRAGAAEPLDEMQIVGLRQPEREIQQRLVTGQPCDAKSVN